MINRSTGVIMSRSAKLLCAASVILGACELKPTDPRDGQQPVVLASVTVTPDSTRLLAGQTVQLTAKGRDTQNREIDLAGRTVIWSVTNNGIATVSNEGLVTAVGNGTTTITATSEGKSGSVGVNSTKITLASIRVGAAEGHTCAVTVTGAAYCWGENDSDQLGVGPPRTQRRVPTAVIGGLVFTDIQPGSAPGSGTNFTCGLTTSNTIYCWGANPEGQFGDGSTIPSAVPKLAAKGGTFAQLAVGLNHVCGRTAAGAVKCWGFGGYGGLGNNAFANSTSPVDVVGGLSFSNVTAGAYFNCGVTGTTGYCWGTNQSGQLGRDTADGHRPAPGRVVNAQFTSISAVSSGGGHACGLAPGGRAYCWGTGGSGQLGNGTTSDRPAPVEVVTGPFSLLVAGNSFTCGIASGGPVYCWGQNDRGQLGTGTTTSSTTPVLVSGGLLFSTLSAGGSTVCGITVNTSVAYCWGNNNSGQLGIGTVEPFRPSPVRVISQ